MMPTSRWIRAVSPLFSHVREHARLLVLLLRREVVGRTSGTWLGGGWLVLQPALQVVAFWFLLDVVLKVRSVGRVPFLEYFLTAMISWLFIQEALNRALTVLSEYAGLYQRTIFPIGVIPLVPLLMSAVIYTPVMLVVSGWLLGPWAVLKALVLLAVLCLVLVPAVYLFAVAGLFVRETRQVMPFAMTLLMYFSPILYQPESLPASLQAWMFLNPLADLITLQQQWLLDSPGSWSGLVRGAAVWAVSLPLAIWLFRRAIPHMREAL